MEFRLFDLGLIDYSAALLFQRNLLAEIRGRGFSAALVVCRHQPVITIGRTGSNGNIKVSASELKIKNIPVYRVERGGDVTYHGPGQMTAYPIFNLGCLKRDLHAYLRQLEGVAIALCSDFGVRASRRPPLTGVWVGEDKIASIGISVKNWFTYHGISINIKKRGMENFNLIRPCGMDISMTSLETVTQQHVSWEAAKERLIGRFREFFAMMRMPQSNAIAAAGYLPALFKEDQS